jgi:hypothetical protein
MLGSFALFHTHIPNSYVKDLLPHVQVFGNYGKFAFVCYHLFFQLNE